MSLDSLWAGMMIAPQDANSWCRLGKKFRDIILLFLLIAALTATAASAQQVGSPSPVRVGVCAMPRTAAARLICADPNLSARDSKLAAAYRKKKSRTPLAEQKELLNEQLIWMRQRDEKCGLIGKDAAPLAELRKAKECMQNEIEARLAQLESTPQLNSQNSVLTSTVPQNSTKINQDIIITPLVPATASMGTAETNSSRKKFHFSATASGVSGSADCGATTPSHAINSVTAIAPKSVIEITPIDDANSFPIFEGDTWRSLLDEVRQAVHAKCIDGLNKTNNGSETASELGELYEVTSSRGLFFAHSTGLNGAWSVETNLPRTRKKLQTDLGIQRWIKPSQLARNPYFFKDVVVGMIVQFDRRVSDKEAVFLRSGARIFVSGVPQRFVDQQMVVLAGRVVGNKGVVDPSGSEELIPAVDYLGTADCGNVCEALSGFTTE